MVQIRVSPDYFFNLPTIGTGGPKSDAPGEARTHGLQIMRLTRCLLRYGGPPSGGEKIVRCGIRTHALIRGPEVSTHSLSGNKAVP